MEDIIRLVRAGKGLNPEQAAQLFTAYETEVKARQIADQEAVYYGKLWHQARQGLLPGLLMNRAVVVPTMENLNETARLRKVLQDVNDYILGHVEQKTRSWRGVVDYVWVTIEDALAGEEHELLVTPEPEPPRNHNGERG